MERSTVPPKTKTESRWLKVFSTLNEFHARLLVADKALGVDRGGISNLSALTGMSCTTITQRGRKLAVPAGGGRKKAGEVDPRLCRESTRRVEDSAAGDPMNLLRWTSKSTAP